MAKKGKFALTLTVACIAIIFSFSACDDSVSIIGSSSGSFFGSSSSQSEDDGYERTPPPLAMPQNPKTNEVSEDDGSGRTASIDLSNVSKGYTVINCVAPGDNLVVRIQHIDKSGNSITSDYSLKNDGTPETYTLADSGVEYEIGVYYQLEGTSFVQLLKTNVQVTLENEFVPFLLPSRIVSYNENSKVVGFSYDLTQKCKTDAEVTQKIYEWVVDNVTYDNDRANLVVEGKMSLYEPDPDTVLAEKKGICYDYASITAAMFRANGIPCKLVKGNVVNGEAGLVYHAWNEIWLDEEGWVTFRVPITPAEWQRIDTTFASGGASSNFIGDGTNYYPQSYY